MTTEQPRKEGWYPHPSAAGKFGFWDGRQWTKIADKMPAASTAATTPAPASNQLPVDAPDPWRYIAFGALLLLVGLGVLASTDPLTPAELADGDSNQGEYAISWFLLAGGSLFSMIGAVGAGVSIGVRHAKEVAARR